MSARYLELAYDNSPFSLPVPEVDCVQGILLRHFLAAGSAKRARWLGLPNPTPGGEIKDDAKLGGRPSHACNSSQITGWQPGSAKDRAAQYESDSGC